MRAEAVPSTRSSRTTPDARSPPSHHTPRPDSGGIAVEDGSGTSSCRMLRRLDSPRARSPPRVRRPSQRGSERGRASRPARLGRIGVGRVGALRGARGVRLRPRRTYGSRHRRPAAPAPRGRDRALRIVARRPLPARAIPAGSRAPGRGRARSVGPRRAAGRARHRVRRGGRGRHQLDALPARAHLAAALARAQRARADRGQRRDLHDREPRHAARAARRRPAGRIRRRRRGLRGQRGDAPGLERVPPPRARARPHRRAPRAAAASRSGRASGRSATSPAHASSSA